MLQEQVFFCLPNESDFHHWVGEIEIHPQSSLSKFLDKDVFLIKPFYGDELYVLFPSQKNIYKANDLPVNLYNVSYFDKNDIEINQSKDEYLAYLNYTIKIIKSGKFDKIVTARKQSKSINNPIDFNQTLAQVQHAYPNAFVSFLQSRKWGNWLGASPEILFNVNNNQWQTVALAGTRKKSTELSWGEKELLEHNKVVEYIQDLLKGSNIMYSQSELKSISMGEIEHLIVTFSNNMNGELDVNNIAQFINALSPTPAVCGFPKIEAFNYLFSNESLDREIYAGYIGPVINKEIHLYVNLRCCKISQNQISYYAGGGINAMSEPELEWIETNQKMELLQSILEQRQ